MGRYLALGQKSSSFEDTLGSYNVHTYKTGATHSILGGYNPDAKSYQFCVAKRVNWVMMLLIKLLSFFGLSKIELYTKAKTTAATISDGIDSMLERVSILNIMTKQEILDEEKRIQTIKDFMGARYDDLDLEDEQVRFLNARFSERNQQLTTRAQEIDALSKERLPQDTKSRNSYIPSGVREMGSRTLSFLRSFCSFAT